MKGQDMSQAQKKTAPKQHSKEDLTTGQLRQVRPEEADTIAAQIAAEERAAAAEERLAEVEEQLAILLDAKETLDGVRDEVANLLNEEVEDLVDGLREEARRPRKRNNSPKAKAKRALRALDRKARKHIGPLAFVAGAASGAGAATVVHNKKDDVRRAGERFRDIKGVEADFEVRKSA